MCPQRGSAWGPVGALRKVAAARLALFLPGYVGFRADQIQDLSAKHTSVCAQVCVCVGVCVSRCVCMCMCMCVSIMGGSVQAWPGVLGDR